LRVSSPASGEWSKGIFGDTRSVGAGIMELRVDYGRGYRIYYVNRGAEIVILLCGGDKRTQQQDIRRAHDLAGDLEKGQ
jgi:putative addiction module killer protein